MTITHKGMVLKTKGRWCYKNSENFLCDGKEILPFNQLEGEKIEFEVLQKLNKSLFFSDSSLCKSNLQTLN